MATARTSPVPVATLVEPTPTLEEADRRLAAIFQSAKFREEGDFSRILDIIESNPKLAHRKYKSVYSGEEMPPLCCILTSEAACSLCVIRRVYDLNRAAVTLLQGRNQDTVLHFACRHNACMPVVEFIHSRNPAAISTLNASGRLPLESLLPGLKKTYGSQSRLPTLNSLLRTSPGALTIQNGRGQTLLETALKLRGWSTVAALESLAERHLHPEDPDCEKLVELLDKIHSAKRLRPRAKQNIQYALLRSAPGLWAG